MGGHVALGKRTVIVAGALAALVLPGCAPAGYNPDDFGGAQAQPVVNAANAANASAAPAPVDSDDVSVDVADEDLTKELVGKAVDKMGNVVTDEDGWLLYRFDKDSNDPPASNCEGDCAKIWPPALTDGDPILSGVKEDVVGTVNRPDGTRQLTIDGWPVYYYAGDEKPGDWKGQGVGGTWYAIQPDGTKNLECLPEGTPKPIPVPAGDGRDNIKGKDKDKDSSGDYDY
jgi:predicted lipoprotein with Yx(FWY)xxD motif